MNNPNNYYAWKENHLKHLSVGALITDAQNKILTVFLERVDGKYFLPTKSHTPNQTLEDTLMKVSHKIGWEIELVGFLGSTITAFPTPESGTVTKTVIWFQCKPVAEIARDPQDRDADAQILWKSKSELMEIFASQAHISSDVDQRNVLDLIP